MWNSSSLQQAAHGPILRPSSLPASIRVIRAALPPVLILTICILSGCSKKAAETAEGEEEKVVPVQVAPVVNASIQQKIDATAVLYPLRQAAIVPKISAPVKKF